MPASRIFRDVTATVGNTPLIELTRLTSGLAGRVAVKHEGYNPFNSVKDRIGAAMVDDAIERRNMLRALGCRVVLTEGPKGMKGAIAKAEELLAELGNRAVMMRQFDNPANPAIHYQTRGPEIWKDTGGQVDVFVSGVGTGGTITGAGRYLREKKPSIRIAAVEPNESPVLSGGAPSPHKQQGIGAGFIPSILDTTIYDEVVRVTNDQAITTTRRLAREEGIFAGISSGSITFAALEIAARPENAGKLIVSIIADFGERYLSNPVYAELPDPDDAWLGLDREPAHA